SLRRSPKATIPGAATGADENASSKHLVPVGAASPKRKKVLGERNDSGVGGMEGAASAPVQQPKLALSPPTPASRGAGPYDPKTNYTTPRPAFLRYDPERRREILLRVSRAAEVMDDDCSSTTSGTAASEEDGGSSLASDAAAGSLISSPPRSDSEAELDDSEEEEEVVPARRGRWARRLLLLLVCVSCSFCYMYCAKPSGFPTYSEDALDLDRGIGGMYDAYDHELDSLRLLGPVHMMGPEDVLEEITNQLVHEDSKSVDHLYGNRAPRNLVAVAMVGLADICLNVSSGEFTCQIGGEKGENVPDLKEDSEMDKLDTELTISFQNDKQSSEVDCLGGNAPLDSIGSTSTHTDNLEGSLESFHLEEWDDYSNQSELQLVSMERAIKSASYKLKDRTGLESEELDLWQYENTAEAAKTICSTVKFLWSAMEPHLLQVLACLSFAGLVAALYRYYQRSRECCNCIITYDSLAEQPLLVQHQVAQLSVTSVRDAQLPVHSSEQPIQLAIPNQGTAGSLEVPMELTLPKLDPLVSLEDPAQESLPMTDPLVTVKIPVIGRGIHDQKLKRGDSENIKASNGMFLNHSDVDSSKPPVVELLGEFVLASSSRERSTKKLYQNAGDATDKKLLKPLKKDEDVEKMQMHSSIIQSPSVGRAKKE
ncbi:hypothetical protein ACJX0J_036053, partial [Zea mays]